MFYFRQSHSTLFLLPCLAIGFDIDGRVFMELGWLNVAIGIGDKP